MFFLGEFVSNLKFHAQNEFVAAGWCDENGVFKDEMQQAICEHVLKLLEVFSEEGHSGSSAPYAINLFSTLAKFKPIAPLTGEDWEWVDVAEYNGSPLWQNKRCSSVFKDETGVYDIDGRVFWEWYRNSESGKVYKTYFTSKGSRVYITFPYTKPEHPEYVFRPSDEFPNEVLE
jgi:hypothetical protein